jgi:GNAT superfamily N-acetyltransferase
MPTDLLVKLYTLPDPAPVYAAQNTAGINIRRALAPEKHLVVDWVREHFGPGWANETDVAFSNHPPSVFLALEQGQMIGFACHDSVCKNFFGPTGVDETRRGRGTGKALLLACLHAMREAGYGYAIIGAAGPVDFYNRVVGAEVIPDSWPGIYADMLWSSDDDG